MVKTSERLQLAAAIIVTIASSFVAWHHSQPAHSSVPSLGMPGAIFVGVKQGSTPAPVRVDVDLRFYPSPNLTSFDMVLKGDDNAAVPPNQAGELMVGFCGAMKDVQLRRTSDGKELTFEPPIRPTNTNPRVSSIGLEFSLDDDCVMTDISPTDFRDTTVGEAGFGWAVSLEGDTTAPTEAFAGSHHRYAFPRIATLTLPAGIGPLDIQAVAAESVVRIDPRGLPAEYVTTVSSPQVEDSTAPGWSFPIQSADTAAGFRLAGVDEQDETEVQRKLFVASAAAGIAGGGLIWGFGALGPLIEDRRHKPLRGEALDPDEPRNPPTATSIREHDIQNSPAHSRLIAASVLSGVAGSMLTWLVSRRKR